MDPHPNGIVGALLSVPLVWPESEGGVSVKPSKAVGFVHVS